MASALTKDTVPSIPFAGGALPAIGLGTACINGAACETAVEQALKMGCVQPPAPVSLRISQQPQSMDNRSDHQFASPPRSPRTRLALSARYRLLDTALLYGNQVEVGAGIRNSGVPREHVWVTSKVVGTRFDRFSRQ